VWALMRVIHPRAMYAHRLRPWVLLLPSFPLLTRDPLTATPTCMGTTLDSLSPPHTF
jgi:hypothetical protein